MSRNPQKSMEIPQQTDGHGGSRQGTQRSSHGPSTQTSISARPSQMQVVAPDQDHDASSRPRNTVRASQMQVAAPGQSVVYGRSENLEDYTPISRLSPAMSSVRNIQPTFQATPPQQTSWSTNTTRGTLHSQVRQPTSYYHPQLTSLPEQMPTSYRGVQSTSIQQQQTTSYGGAQTKFNLPQQSTVYRVPNQLIRTPVHHEANAVLVAATRYAERPQGVHTLIICPGEPHHFGSRADYERGELHCTLCRCHNPDSHGDAYTMLNSPRGCDIHGQPIDWQEAKRRILDYYQRDQISHAEEIAVARFVFDAPTTQIVLQGEAELTQSIRQGLAININTVHNNVDWHNSDGHAKPYLTQDGAKTQYSR
ncbi:hypothetical protein HBI56_131470 [Parastagonospora nodorum]|nr:hypothetical protein HBH53_218280 [Parastagonospora nodorum]KAH3996820.1 hypothetical protein HBI10_153390 [Parastagonospora nodorum]KAH4012575.1 hypothetical protein HBI13_188080 [Parastagonospora nodorum]KAH4029583.1 hypothetical protein HBI09_135200 [Parastagonospora nodorum]KAH4047522.1 hypothetical protein HBH49_166300 [Parastagonospora nodorum]